MDTYNRSTFPLDMEDEAMNAWPALHTAGDRAPGGQLIDAHTGEEINLASLWRRGPLVIEFGSFT